MDKNEHKSLHEWGIAHRLAQQNQLEEERHKLFQFLFTVALITGCFIIFGYAAGQVFVNPDLVLDVIRK